MDIEEITGLGDEAKADWPRITSGADAPMEQRLKQDSKLHKDLFSYLQTRIRMSEEEMQKFYPRWQVQEKKVQAYIDLPSWEKALKEMNDSGKPPSAVRFVVPYSYATISTIVTYLFQTFCGRKPMFSVSSYKNESTHAARMMELVLQYNADHSQLTKELYQFLQDGETYGVQILRTSWKEEYKMRTVWKQKPQWGFARMFMGASTYKEREERLTYAGNDVKSVDPFMFFPDPRVPMCEVSKRGEFVFWRSFEGKHAMKLAEANGDYFNIDQVGDLPATNWTNSESHRGLIAGGNSIAGDPVKAARVKNFMQVDQGSVTIIPRELGLSSSDKPEKWMFAIGNRRQIIQAEPIDNDHDMHPVVVGEPYSLGYGFGQPGISDYSAPMQDILSWLVNSHIENVRTALNNMIVVDPSMVEMQDLKSPGPGKLIRLKESAQGRDIRSVLQQLQIVDVTGSHLRDFPVIMKIADAIGAVNDNIRGIQSAGGRKSATEVRLSGEAGASRLAAHARLISAQSLTQLTEQMCLNVQQYLDDEFFIDLVGMQGLQYPLRQLTVNPMKTDENGNPVDPMQITPEMLVGDFYYPVSDGTLPMDKVALLDSWRQIFQAVASNPMLAARFDLIKIFEFIGQLSGAQNLGEFKIDIQAQADEQVAAAAQSGNAVPIGGGNVGAGAPPG